MSKRLRELARSARASWYNPQPDMLLRYEHTLLELSLLVMEAAFTHEVKDVNREHERVRTAIKCFTERIGDNPSLEQIAREVGSSAPHLRRLFHRVMGTSPKRAFDQIRFQRAFQLMAEPETKLSEVGESCGFESPSAFSRAFKNKFGCSPDRWRNGVR
ncbi:AraC family transcriptional regulator [Ruficoccus sp. ZRK36]|uniref:helix-turn-helix transcriptional regulator n=1 Tax=Ruficoccus sp. ZRK36 TaxID=2866311 RepID=UPI001C73297F|nr:AraC family transcriptional regulator [Ruficoccus sp. ZRK36]QYY37242.1 AraC family transcriptional regulator [Ruficoccus sp. ZRK36]